MKKNKKIYFTGIKGVGMTSLAIIAKQAGLEVSGSDLEEEFITDKVLKKEEIFPKIGFSIDNIDSFTQDSDKENVTVICTSAHGGLNNVEVNFAKEKEFKVMTHGQAVGAFMDGKIFDRKDINGISVSGSHGKTTISAMISTYLSKMGANPSYAVGTSEIFPIGSAGHYGKGKYFIAEADEYVSDIKYDRTPKFLYQYPKMLIINNIDFDHPDFYKDISQIEEAFFSFTKNISEDGVLIINGDDNRARTLVSKATHLRNVITYGTNPANDFVISRYTQDEFNSYFSINSKDVYLGDVKLSVPGFHNAKNALSVITLLLQMGYSFKQIKDICPSFLGTKRRMELIDKSEKGATIIDDYAHHPYEIKTTLSVIRKIFPKKKIICIFQPHTYSRTKNLLDEFTTAFYEADLLILLPIYLSLREIEYKKESDELLEKLYSGLKKVRRNILLLKEKESVIEYIRKNYLGNNFVILTLGAGDVYKITESLKQK